MTNKQVRNGEGKTRKARANDDLVKQSELCSPKADSYEENKIKKIVNIYVHEWYEYEINVYIVIKKINLNLKCRQY